MKKLLSLGIICSLLLLIKVSNSEAETLETGIIVNSIPNNEVLGGELAFVSKGDSVISNGDFIVGTLGIGGELVVEGVLMVNGDFYNAFGSKVTVNGKLIVKGAFYNFESKLNVNGTIAIENGFDNLYGSEVKCGGGVFLVAEH